MKMKVKFIKIADTDSVGTLTAVQSVGRELGD